jgi:putative (di)nucleoside polyphosphate hydrolase
MGVSTVDKDRVIDEAGFRPNVGIVVTNRDGQVLWGKRVKGKDSWQFPQGGIDSNEDPQEAMFRELREEIGLLPEHVTVLGVTKGWLRYRLPAKYVRKNESPICIGQKQKWFLLRLDAPDDAVRLDVDKKPEFRDWQWVSYWHPISSVVDFKQQVYRSALSELVGFNLPKANTRRRRRKR